MMNRTLTIYTLGIVLFLSFVISAQTIEQKNWLIENSARIKKIEDLKKAEADSLAKIYGMPISTTLSNGAMIELQSFEDGMPYYHMTDNINAAATLSTRYVWDNGAGGFSLSGLGQVVGLWEAGNGIPLLTHQELSGKVTQRDAGGTYTDHATHVAGTLVATGIVSNARGMSKNAKVDAYTSGNDLSEIMNAAANGLKVSNHSYGSIRGWVYDYRNDGKWAWFGTTSISETEDYLFGFYSSTSASWDYFMVNAPNILVCKSAGNDRGDGPTSGTAHWVLVNNNWVWSSTVREKDGGIDGYDCINDGVGISKNSLTVGAVNDIVNGYNSPSDVVVTSWSNEGPTDDGRIKPDIVANGTDLYSSTNSSNTAYENMSGTSMASPNAAGSVALILEQQAALNGPSTFLRSSTVKGLIINTTDEAGTAPGPDYRHGWGLMNTYRAIQLLTLNHEVGGNQLIRELTLNQSGVEQFTVESNGSDPLKVTICWLDPSGTPAQASLNPPNLMLVNDLDLTITGPNSTVYYPWVLDPANPSAAATTGNNFRDNVEQVFIESPVAGTYTIKVGHKNNLTTGSQKFSIIISGTVVPVPDIVSLVEPINNAQGISSTQVLCKWTRAPKSMRYELQASLDSTFNTGVISVLSKTVTATLTNLPELSVVYWRVRAINSGGIGAWSAVNKFTTTYALPSPPALLIPANNSVHQNIDQEFQWEDVSNATEYKFQLSNNVPFTDIIIDTTLSTNSFNVNDLQEGKKLYWRVSSINPSGTSAYSPKSNFTTKLKSPDSLTVSVNLNDDVVLNWIDKSSIETNYLILRKTESSSYTKLDSLGADQTSYIDTSAQFGVGYHYAVYCRNSTAFSDTTESALIVVSVEKEEDLLPTEYSLKQNYPNPFNPSTVIKYSLAKDGFVNIAVFNLLGEKVATLVNTIQRAGNYEVNFNASSLSSGIYFYAMESGDFRSVRKMLLMK